MTGAGWRDTWHWLARAALSRWWDCRGHHLWVSEESHGEIPGRVVLLPCESFLLPMQEPNGIVLNSEDPGQENVKLEQ